MLGSLRAAAAAAAATSAAAAAAAAAADKPCKADLHGECCVCPCRLIYMGA